MSSDQRSVNVMSGQFQIWNVLAAFSDPCHVVVESDGEGKTHLWIRLDNYTGSMYIIHVQDVVSASASARDNNGRMPITWRARSIGKRKALVDDRLKGDVRFEEKTNSSGSVVKIDLMLHGAGMGREMWIEGIRCAEHNQELQTKLLDEIKTEWKAMADEPRQAKLEDVINHYGCIF